ncbi:MAG TPA: DUF2461 domain-containing protein [Gordonia polyisoprenivorans]|uniref:DUF2461 domain-containing protein n=1 Tax=Gordonia polyisoprenivorans TaxID=84595 RepID=A0A846WRZ2_9ACTN|nr:DUF2461 domain-containing protein [Gordonia polyisoprenivorans]NKY03530.1 DUF2461 domain-containing protein [Gordonia polyisoprenivorans]QUD84749.1 DUF2461 domain-containing protein [Gordonia polyisoprenivorans]GAB23034.1 hypothetical protein GOPIP_038_00230 [Gordonia polyisoprenivorans NBRC 16320 = JCM 10675]HCS56918.1 DUF2461 domain-containing protein [Gordonia polyisoprenivorans]
MGFTGFPEAALDFYDDLEIDNTKAFWTAHKATYSSAVAEPMAALTADLAEEFGEAKLFRPYRDVRFAKDKSPYKTHQGAYVAVAPATGYYVQIGAPGVRVGGGIYDTSADRLTAIRAAIVNERSGTELERIVGELSDAGWEVGGDKLKTAPRGFDRDHPRIDLLRHKTITVMRDYGFDPVIHTADLVDRVRVDWRTTTPLIEWILRHGNA